MKNLNIQWEKTIYNTQQYYILTTKILGRFPMEIRLELHNTIRINLMDQKST